MLLRTAIWVCITLTVGTIAGDTWAVEPIAPPVLDFAQLTRTHFDGDPETRWKPHRVNLAPAQWIWLPSERTLPNSFVLFRKEFELEEKPVRAVGWMTADSRYRLTVNGQRVQWGPAPCDPRQLDVDPIDLTELLQVGRNVIGVEVLYYGIGEGTWAAGKPGLIFHAMITPTQGEPLRIISDPSWLCLIDRAHPPAQPKRWFLRALQEEFDARLHPYGWDTVEFQALDDWMPASVLPVPADKPAACGGYTTTDSIDQAAPAVSALRARQIPLVQETTVPAAKLADSGLVHWKRDPLDWFDFRVPNSFEITRPALVKPLGPGAWQLPATDERSGMYVTFEFTEQIVGFPGFEIDAPAGTVIELMTQEAHDPQTTPWLDNHFYSWTRFICRGGVNRFEAFDYESLRWLQLHVRGASAPVTIRNVGVRRRMYPWQHEPIAHCSEPALQKLFNASVNTLYNSAIETAVDGMGRERQQYSGDGGHQLLAIRTVLGEPLVSSRFLRTFSEGLSKDGYFLDCWPAYDRLARVSQKQIDGAYWGPLLDHGIGFNFDCWNHYLETGDLAAISEPYPRLLRFADYLLGLRRPDGLLPVEDLGIPTVWIDHVAYRAQRHKQCAFNLYAAAMLQQALAPLAEAMGDTRRANQFRMEGAAIQVAVVRHFWSAEQGLFVDNLPWLDEEKGIRTSDRTLATSILFGQCPGDQQQSAVEELATCPDHMGFSYPCNAGWRLWALAKAGRGDIVVNDLRTRWATMRSVLENNTLQEDWVAHPDTREQWSHCAVVPLYVLAQDIAGIRPTKPGYASCVIRPQLGDLPDLQVAVHTPHGPIQFQSRREAEKTYLHLEIPGPIAAELIVPASVAGSIELPESTTQPGGDLRSFVLQPGKAHDVVLDRRSS